MAQLSLSPKNHEEIEHDNHKIGYSIKIALYGALLASLITLTGDNINQNNDINHNIDTKRLNKQPKDNKSSIVDDWIIKRLLDRFETEYYKTEVTRICQNRNFKNEKIKEIRDNINQGYPTKNHLAEQSTRPVKIIKT